MQDIYFDHNASTPLAPEARRAMEDWLDHAANPTSGHRAGQAAARAIEQAREDLARMLDCAPEEVYFTSGGTEADNWALRGICHGEPGHLVSSAIEHPAVMETVHALRREGWQTDLAPVDGQGRVRIDELRGLFTGETRICSLMLANNETGAIQPVGEMAAAARERGIVSHTDAAQALGKHPVSFRELGVDLLTLAGHKMNAPIGVGALLVRKGLELKPLLYGAGHERGLRPGTLNLHQIVALGAAAKRFRLGREEVLEHNRSLRNAFVMQMRQAVPGLQVNGEEAERLGNTASLAFPGILAGDLLAACPWLAASAGAACNRDFTKASHVLQAMGLPMERIRSTIRFSFGLGNRMEEIPQAVAEIRAAWERLTKKP